REAARIARDNPELDVGLHAVVCMGRSVLPRARLGALVDGDGRFPQGAVGAGLRWFFDRKLRDALAAELRAQVERHLELVGYLNHIDGHLNFHVHPTIADVLVALAVEFRVPCLRLPREPAFTTLLLARDHAAQKLIGQVIFRALSRRTSRLMSARKLRSSDWLFGLHQSGHLSEPYLRGVIERLRDGVTELYFHPALDLGATPPPAAAQLEAEMLVSPWLRQAIERGGIELTNFAKLARGESLETRLREA
ncbi:MAG TPA: ChbG/HpnK family deacetylase, partial [Candidatus Binataceae bacterium]|nr:ChbG/HpnK family deacetylase [Candidatus Binataceae bacterium]